MWLLWVQALLATYTFRRRLYFSAVAVTVVNSAFGLPVSGRWADLLVFRFGSKLRDGDRGAAAATVGFRIGSGAGYRVGKP
jgi:hypothetical protein